MTSINPKPHTAEASSRRVLGFGTFDGIHPGHEFYLKELGKLGDEVAIIIARDHNVERIKGRAPKHSEADRLAAVKATGLADKVVLGQKEDFLQSVRDQKPDVIGLGYDQNADEKALSKEFPEIEIYRLPAFEPEKYKSSLLNR